MNRAIFERLRAHLEADELVALVTLAAGPGAGAQRLVRPGADPLGGLGPAALDSEADRLAAEGLSSFASRRSVFEHDGASFDLFCDVYAPAPKLFIVGAVHVAVHLCRFARELGYRTVVIDPRTAFATPERFADADRLDARWPEKALADHRLDEASCLATLSHDQKIDLPALAAALDSPARYIGALGSKRTHAKRVAALEEMGYGGEQIGRIHSPIGFDLGGRKAEEIALAVMAEIVAAAHGKA